MKSRTTWNVTISKSVRQFKEIFADNKKSILAVILVAMLTLTTLDTFGQRNMEYLSRGLVAVNTDDYVFVSWRIFVTDGDSVSFNLYRDGVKITDTPLSGISNYSDADGEKTSVYYLETVYNSGKTDISTPVTVWEKQYKTINMQLPDDSYYPNDASIGDLNGDGEMEIILKIQNANPDNTGSGEKLDPVYLHAYKMNGTLMWSINLGINIRPGSHYTQFMVYDLDNDGIAEIACKTAPGTMDGTGNYLSTGPAADDDDAADYRTSAGMVLSGPEYLTVFNGQTGAEINTVEYIPLRGKISDWGDSYGNRVDRFLAGVAYLDGENPSLVMCRGYYTRTVIAAWDFQGDTLASRWVFDTDEDYSSYAGQGNHQLSIADGDNDGKDEIYYGAMAVDDDGTGLWNTGHGHGDAMHVSDIAPENPGLEKWGVYEGSGVPGSALLDAATGEIIWATAITDDDIGRGVSADVSPDFLGMECWGGTDGLRSCKDEYVGRSPSSANFAIWWDGDLCRELLDGIYVQKYAPDSSMDTKIMTATGCSSNNGTKSVPNLSGDIFGDWREEVIFRTEDNTQLRIYTTTTPTDYGIYTLLQDPQYRLALVWQNVGYNQPPHPGFYLGHGMDLDTMPIPDIAVREVSHSSINITAPVDSFELGLGLDLNITAHTTGLSTTDDDVVIWQDGVAVDTITGAPYFSTIKELTTGYYTFTATAKDLSEGALSSDAIVVYVDEGYPHVEITSPEDEDTYLPDKSITLAANAWDTDGDIDSVVFLLNDSSVATITSAPYSIEIGSPGIGAYVFEAVAYDNDLKSTEAESIDIAVGVVSSIEEYETGFCGFAEGDGWVESNNDGFSGEGFSNSENVTGVQIVYGINFPETGLYKFETRYACSSARPGNLLIDGEQVAYFDFENTVDFTTWYTITQNTDVSAGIHKVALEATVSGGLPNIDYLRVYSLESGEEVVGVACDSLIPNTTATLSELSVDEASISPAFDSGTFAYVIEIEEGTTELHTTAVLTDTLGTIDYDTLTTVTTVPGTIDINVTSRNGANSNTYTISYDYIADATLSALSVEGYSLTPEFSSDELSYDIAIEEGTTQLRVSATPTDSRATATYDTLVEISKVPATIKIVVSSPAGVNKNTYKVTYDYVSSVGKLTTGDLKIYPVPAQDYLNVQMGNNTELIQDIAVWSMEGKKLVSSNELNTNTTRLDMSTIPNGMYIIHVKTNENTYSKKITVSNK